MRLLKNCSQMMAAAVFLLPSAYTLASTLKENQPLQIPYTTEHAVIDGNIDDAIWDKALNVDLNIVNSPWNNEPSPVKTQAKIIENGSFLYVAFIAQDPEPEKINGFLADRDTTLGQDLVGIKLDTFNSRQFNYNFLVNPYGVQNDSIGNELTGETNLLWDAIWESYGKITDTGYQVEIAIPYHILNFDQNNNEKTWAIELLRTYPRDERLRISHITLDRNDDCWVCQMPEIKGFKNAKVGNNLLLTPSVVASNDQNRDIYSPNDKWHTNNDIDAGLDISWGVNANSTLNATINPDFSTVESDAGQLSVNKNFSLYYDEKRSFFLENSDYFSSNYNLVYTRNIADPDYGVKFTGRDTTHSYGFFVTNDTETNFIVPGNLGDDLAILDTESYSAAFNYRYNLSPMFSLGAISTLRTADDYHNIVAGLDAKYRFDDTNSLTMQALHSNTEYPDALYQDFCLSDDGCGEQQSTDCVFGNCAYSEQVHRTKYDGDFSDQAFTVELAHNSEYWELEAEFEKIGEDFRADLGYLPTVDYQKTSAEAKRLFYGEDDTIWQNASIGGEWQMKHNANGELIERELEATFTIDGPKLSFLEVIYLNADKVGLRHDDSSIDIDGNTTRFDENQWLVYGEFKPTSSLLLASQLTTGDKIDYKNNRLGDYNEFYGEVSANVTKHLKIDLNFTYSELDAQGSNVYRATLTDLRVAYQFDVQSYLKLSVVYSDVDRNPDNNPYIDVSERSNNLTTQLIYAYKFNAQTVFFLGYSDSSYQDDYLNNLEREKKTFFTKVSYAWRP